MKNLHIRSWLLLTVLFTLSSCRDDDAEAPKPLTNTEILTAKPWKVSKISTTGSGNSNYFYSLTNSREAADLKNSLTTFNSDGTCYQVFAGSSVGGVWEFSNDETRIVFDLETPTGRYWDIVELKDNSLVVKSLVLYKDIGGQPFLPSVVQMHLVHAQ